MSGRVCLNFLQISDKQDTVMVFVELSRTHGELDLGAYCFFLSCEAALFMTYSINDVRLLLAQLRDERANTRCCTVKTRTLLKNYARINLSVSLVSMFYILWLFNEWPIAWFVEGWGWASRSFVLCEEHQQVVLCVFTSSRPWESQGCQCDVVFLLIYSTYIKGDFRVLLQRSALFEGFQGYFA